MTMRRFLPSAALAIAVVTAAGCRGRGVASPDARENAYRANNLGVALLEQFKYDEAAAAFRRGLAVDPSLALVHVNLGIALLYAQDLVGAAREASEAARLMPSAPQPPYVLGLIARAENREADALRFFDRVQKIDPHDTGTNTNLGQIFMQERKYPEAMAVLRLAVADEPYNLTAVYNLGLALTRSGQTDEGQRMLERSQALRPTGYAVTFGTAYLEQGRYAEAIVSTGLEPELVDATVPDATFTPVTIGSAPRAAGSPPPSPFGRRFAARELTAAGASALAAGLGGCVTLIDVDRDGDLDLFVATPGGQQLLRNDRDTWTDVTTASGLETSPSDAVPIGCIAADYDNDGMPDLFVLRSGASSLYRNDGHGRFSDVTAAAGIPPYPFLPGAAALVDVDHDGDLDLVIAGLADVAATRERGGDAALLFPGDFEPAPVQLLRNNGNGTFTDITRSARLDLRTHAVAIAPTDFDNRRDVDLLIVNDAAPPMLFKNLRDGTFQDVAADVGLAAAGRPGDAIAAIGVADVNKDGFPDIFFARASGGLFALSDGRGRFTLTSAPDGAQQSVASQFIDYDNDGLLDLLTWSARGPHMFRNVGQRWSDVTARAVDGRGAAAPPQRSNDIFTLGGARALALGDVDLDGRTDIVTASGSTVTLWRNSGDSRRHSARVRLAGTVSNRSAVGAKVQLRAGSLSAQLDTAAATPPVAPADLVFGLGARAAADVVRVLWPSGILQAETPAAGDASPFTIQELNRKPSSCPFLFTWNGTRFEFVTDFLGGGEMGYWEGPGERNTPDPVEYVRIGDDQLRPRDGRFELRVTNELEEALFLDRLQLLAIAHPAGVDVFPNEGMTDPPKPFRLFAVSAERAPVRATDDRGHDVTALVARRDRLYPDDFDVAPFRGYAASHALTLDLGSPREDFRAAMLLLTGWTDYAFSSDNVAAHQAGLALRPPALQIRAAGGAWRDAIADIGIPVGRPQTIAVDLSGRLRQGEHEVRIVTNMRIYWDQILVARAVADAPLQIVRLDPRAATLGRRGFSAEVRPDGREPIVYDYAHVSATETWKLMPGDYTREGDVTELIRAADDMFAIAAPGDEVAVSFDAEAAGRLPDGWRRTFLLKADGFSKEMDINSASPDTLAPLPFHAMSRYPYGSDEQYPDGPAYSAYRARYNTRRILKLVPSLTSK
jgi:Flp pilus assembly protein TadD